jgi:large subunit ribosomal protein L9
MRVILRSDISGLGKRGDICDVKDGYARNYLFPGSLAIRASDGATRQAAAMRRARDLRDAQDRSAAQTVATTLVTKVISIAARTGSENRLYGSVTTADIAEAIAAQTGITIDKRKISADPIKTTGTHSATVRLHADVVFPVRVEVAGNGR